MRDDRQGQLSAGYYWGEHWRRVRQAAIADRLGRCEECGSRDQLHVHHLFYDRIGAEEVEDLQVLCRDCHGWLHPARRKEWDATAAKRRWLERWYAASEPVPQPDDFSEARQEVAEEGDYWTRVDWSGESDDVYPDA